jgi:hypothetical protein
MLLLYYSAWLGLIDEIALQLQNDAYNRAIQHWGHAAILQK